MQACVPERTSPAPERLPMEKLSPWANSLSHCDPSAGRSASRRCPSTAAGHRRSSLRWPSALRSAASDRRRQKSDRHAMRVEDPLDEQILRLDERKDIVGTSSCGGPGLFVEIEHGVDDRATPRRPICHDILDRRGSRVEEGLYEGSLVSRPPSTLPNTICPAQ